MSFVPGGAPQTRSGQAQAQDGLPEELPSSLTPNQAADILRQRHEGGPLADVEDINDHRRPPQDEPQDHRRDPEPEGDADYDDHVDVDQGDGDELSAAEVREIAYLEQLAEAHGAEIEDILAIKHKFKDGDEEVEASLADWRTAYENRREVQTRQQQLAQAHQQIAQVEAQRQQQWAQEQARVAQSLKDAELYYRSALDSPELKALREDDPEAYIRQTEEVEAHLQHVRKQRLESKTAYDAEQQRQYQMHVWTEQQRLHQMRPNWTEKDGARVQTLMNDLGFSPQERHTALHSASMVVALNDLALQREGQKQATQKKSGAAGKKTQRKLPRIASSGKGERSARGNSEKTANARRAKAIKEKIRKNPRQGASLEDAAELINLRRGKQRGRR